MVLRPAFWHSGTWENAYGAANASYYTISDFCFLLLLMAINTVWSPFFSAEKAVHLSYTTPLYNNQGNTLWRTLMAINVFCKHRIIHCHTIGIDNNGNSAEHCFHLQIIKFIICFAETLNKFKRVDQRKKKRCGNIDGKRWIWMQFCKQGSVELVMWSIFRLENIMLSDGKATFFASNSSRSKAVSFIMV